MQKKKVIGACYVGAREWEEPVPFGQHVQATLMSKHHLPWQCSEQFTKVFLLNERVWSNDRRCCSNGLLSFPPFFSLFLGKIQKCFFIFFVSNLILILLISIYFIFLFSQLNLIFNFISNYLILIYYYVKFDPYFFYC